jgi:hypothetical protein
MERQPVDFDDQEALKEEVHSSYAVDPDLGLCPDPHIPEQDTRQGFDQGTRPTINFRKDFTGPPTPVAQQVSPQVFHCDVAADEGTFDHHK